MEDQQLRDLFSKKLANAEAPVDPALWGKISNAAGMTSAAGTGAATSTVLGWIGAAVAVVAITSAVVFFSSDEKDTVESETTVADTLVESTDEPVIDEPEIAPENNATSSFDSDQESQKAQTQRSTQQVVGNDPAADTILLETFKELPKQEVDVQNPEVVDVTPEVVETEVTTPEEPNNVEDEVKADPLLSAKFSFFSDPYDEMTLRFDPQFDDGVHYVWLFGDGTTSTQMSPEHTYEEEGSFDVMLQVVDRNGFTEKQNVVVEAFLPAQIVLPNVFTPNGDGRNDYLTIGEDSRKVNIERILVYDSNGALVFEQLGEGPGWDGTDRSGNTCDVGNYRLIVVATSNAGQQFNESQMVRLQR